MTINDKGLLRAMKAAYKKAGYDVAMSDNGLLIQAEKWGVQLHPEMVPNSVKSLIVLHCGAMPRPGKAVHVQKSECGDMILDTVTGTMEDLACSYTANGGLLIKPTRLTFDGNRVWQLADTHTARLVDPEYQQILMLMYGEKMETKLVDGVIYSRMSYGCSVYIRTEMILSEDKPLLTHLSQMQWIPVELD